jgi:hypothetical protein
MLKTPIAFASESDVLELKQYIKLVTLAKLTPPICFLD